jgi:hypothetical protein
VKPAGMPEGRTDDDSRTSNSSCTRHDGVRTVASTRLLSRLRERAGEGSFLCFDSRMEPADPAPRAPDTPAPPRGYRPLVAALVAAPVLAGAGGPWWQIAHRSSARAPTPARPVRPAPPDRTDVPALPPYIMGIAIGVFDKTAPPPGEIPPVIVSPDSRLEIVVRPEHPITEQPAVKLFWVMGGRAAVYRASFERASSSTLRYRDSGQRPFGAGRGDLVAIISPVPDIPDDIDTAWLDRPPRHWQVRRQGVKWP